MSYSNSASAQYTQEYLRDSRNFQLQRPTSPSSSVEINESSLTCRPRRRSNSRTQQRESQPSRVGSAASISSKYDNSGPQYKEIIIRPRNTNARSNTPHSHGSRHTSEKSDPSDVDEISKRQEIRKKRFTHSNERNETRRPSTRNHHSQSVPRRGPPRDAPDGGNSQGSPFSSRSSVITGSNEHRVNVSDIKRVLDKLKTELENERKKNRNILKDRREELEKLRDDFNQDKKETLHNLQQDFKQRERLAHDELRRKLGEKESEMERIRAQFDQEKEHLEKSIFNLKAKEKASKGTSDILLNLQNELKNLRSSYRQLEERYQTMKTTENKSNLMIESMKLKWTNIRHLPSEGGVAPTEVHDAETITSSASLCESESCGEVTIPPPSPPVNNNALILSRSLEALRVDLDSKLVRMDSLLKNLIGNQINSQDMRHVSEILDTIKELSSKVERAKFLIDSDQPRKPLISDSRRVSRSGSSSSASGSDSEDEKKILSLKKRNGELVSLLRRQEEKLKSLQQSENSNKIGGPGPTVDSSQEATLEAMRREFDQRRSNDLAEHAKAMLKRDQKLEGMRRQVEDLRKREQSRLAPATLEREALEKLVKTMQMEKMKLEKQLTMHRTTSILDPSVHERLAAVTQRLAEAEQARLISQKERIRLENKTRQLSKLEEALSEKDQETHLLRDSLSAEHVRANQLTNENKHLRSGLDSKDQEFALLLGENKNLHSYIHQMERLLTHLKEAAEKRRELEREHNEVKAILELKQQEKKPGDNETNQSVANNKGSQDDESTENLKSKLRELEKRCALQALKHEEVLLELESFKKKQRYEEFTSKQFTNVNDITSGEDSFINGYSREMNQRSSSKFLVDDDSTELTNHTTSFTTTTTTTTNNVAEATLLAKPNRTQPIGDNLRVFVAKYNYDPYHYSPNENPDLELNLTIGDYIIVNGDMDEDGFFYGELIDGRRGLVPSNFVEPVNVADLGADFTISSIFGRPDGASTTSEDDKVHYAESDVPAPKRISIERQLSNSVIISWQSPSNHPATKEINSYHIYVDGQFKTSVKFGEKTRTVLENVDFNENHRISIRSVTSRGQSKDAECCLVVGKRTSAAPSRLKVTQLTSNSGKLSWLPGNSNYYHVVMINDRLLTTCPPGQYKTLLTGLQPDSLQRVHVIARRSAVPPNNPSITMSLMSEQHGSLALSVEFRTLPLAESSSNNSPKHLPDSPLDVQVDLASQEGCVIVTWLPVNTEHSLAQLYSIKGYVIHINGKPVLDVPGAASDHTILPLLRICQQLPPTSTNSGPGSLDDTRCSYLTMTTYAEPRLSHPSSSGDQNVESKSSKPPVALYSNFLIKVAGQIALRLHHFGSALSLDASDPDLAKMDYSRRGQDAIEVGKSPSDELDARSHSPTKSHPVPEIQITQDNSLSDEDYHSAPSLRMHHRGRSSPPHHPRDSRYRESRRHVSGSSNPSGRESSSHRQHHSSSDEGRSGSRHRSVEKLSSSSWHHSHQYGQYQAPNHHHRSNRHHRMDNHRPHSDSPRTLREKGTSRGRRQQLRDTVEEGVLSGDSLTEELDWAARMGQAPLPSDQMPANLPYVEEQQYGVVPPPIPERLDRMEAGRVFQALFDYDPSTMSPNPDAVQEELPFRMHQLIKIFGDKDDDGFYLGECNGRRGLVPYNMVIEVNIEQQTDLQMQQQPPSTNHYPKETSRNDPPRPPRGPHHGYSPQHPESDRSAPHYKGARAPNYDNPHMNKANTDPANGATPDLNMRRKMVALYDYDPTNGSPNVDIDAELGFHVGDVIFVYGQVDEDGFYEGELINGQRGLVPSNFLRETPSDYDGHPSSGLPFDSKRPGRKHRTSQERPSSLTNTSSPIPGTHHRSSRNEPQPHGQMVYNDSQHSGNYSPQHETHSRSRDRTGRGAPGPPVNDVGPRSSPHPNNAPQGKHHPPTGQNSAPHLHTQENLSHHPPSKMHGRHQHARPS